MQKQKRLPRTEADINAIAHDFQELEILDDVRRLARKHGVLLRAALGPSRSPSIVLARDAIIEFLRGRFQYSCSETAKLLRMDHTTVLASMQRTKERKNGSSP